MMRAALDVASARAIIAAPHMHTDEGLRHAVDCLLTYGDWIDVGRAKLLAERLDLELDHVTPREIVAVVVGGLAMFGGLLIGFWLGCGLGWQ